MSFTSSASEIYLTRVGEELVLNEGVNLATKFPPVKRVLVVGGGVTGLTVGYTYSNSGQ